MNLLAPPPWSFPVGYTYTAAKTRFDGEFWTRGHRKAAISYMEVSPGRVSRSETDNQGVVFVTRYG